MSNSNNDVNDDIFVIHVPSVKNSFGPALVYKYSAENSKLVQYTVITPALDLDYSFTKEEVAEFLTSVFYTTHSLKENFVFIKNTDKRINPFLSSDPENYTFEIYDKDEDETCTILKVKKTK